MKIKGVDFRQGDERLFIGSVKVKDLVGKLESGLWGPDIYKSSNPEGYQRVLSQARAREFGRFMVRKGISPLSILLNFREGAVTENTDGTLELPEGKGHVVDGQHRVEGLRYALEMDTSVGEVDMPIVIMNIPERYEEAKQFVTINRTQKGVRADLAERFLLQFIKKEGRARLIEFAETGVLRRVLSGAEWKTKALEIADMLNSDSASVWRGKIRLPNEPRNGTIIAQKSLTDSLEPILKDHYFEGKDVKAIAGALRNYWGAIAELCEAAFEEPAEYVLQKTVGVGVLHKVFARVSELCIDSKGNRMLRKDVIKSVLDGLPLMTSGFWASGGEAGRRGTGRKAVNWLRMEFLEGLEQKVIGNEQKLIT